MFRAIFISCVSLFSLAMAAQVCPPQTKARVLAPSGLIFRAAPGLSSEVLTTVPYDSTVRICTEREYGSLTVEGGRGYWRYAEWRQYRGYLYDGFLAVVALPAKESAPSAEASVPADTLAPEPRQAPEKEDSLTEAAEAAPAPAADASAQPNFSGSRWQFVTEAYNYCGPVQDLDPGLLWYGVYLAEEAPFYQIKPVQLTVQLSSERLSQALEFDILTDQPERSLFLFGHDREVPVDQMRIPQREGELQALNRRIFPGQNLLISREPKSVLSATGAVLRTGDCPEMEHYRLFLELGKEPQKRQQELSALLPAPGLCALPDIYWIGDLGGDGIPEIILVQSYEQRLVFSLLSSQGANAEAIMKLQAQFIQSDCD